MLWQEADEAGPAAAVRTKRTILLDEILRIFLRGTRRGFDVSYYEL